MADNEKEPVRQSLCASLRRDGHWKCLCLTLLIVGCLAAISWCHLTIAHKKILTFMEVTFSNTERSGPCKEGYIYIPVAFVIMLYLVYLVECWHSHTRLELRYKCDIASVYNTIYQMQSALPVIWWKATCYHYVRRTRHVMRYRNGDAFTSTQVYYERVDSKTAGAAFNHTQCGVKDISRPLTDLEKYPAIKIKISKGFSFANLDTEFEFEEQRAQFFQEYETKDDYMEGREGMDLVNVDFKEYMIAFRDPDNLPWYVSHAIFWLASLLLLSWPLRAIIEFKTAHLHYHIHKLFGSNYLEAESYPPIMSRVSTMNSVDLEMSIRNNNVIVPSYSEAMLAEAQQAMRRDYGAIKKNGGKFPRSLTNVTLSARSSVGQRSLTPTVTMNQVKKFKSCSAFVKSDSSEGSSGSIRQQIQQLLRDRGRLQRKTNGASSFSVSALSMVNGNVRFNVGTPVSPDDTSMSYSLSCYSVASSRTNDVSTEAAVTSAGARPERAKSSTSGGKTQRVKQVTGIMNRSKSVPGSDSDIVHILRKHHPGDSNGSRQSLAHSNPIPIPGCSRAVRPSTSTPVTHPSSFTAITPPSPPSYEDAIMMRRITSPRPPSTAPLTPITTLSEIELTWDSPLAVSKGEITIKGPCLAGGEITAARPWLDEQQNTGPQLGSLTQIAIDTALSSTHSGHGLSRVSTHEPAVIETSQASTSQADVQHSPPTRRLPTLKPLPKVNAPRNYSDSEDSDSECLPMTSSLEQFRLENVSDPNAPRRSHGRTLRRVGSMSPPASSHHSRLDLAADPSTGHIHDRTRPYTAASASNIRSSGTRHHRSRRKETPV
ncbi:uncharacterized protein LOC131944488 isoform X2 [Physella acuta]|uniref:uncharacterized protein LOC131944488 isoform X2 n=1 Tax=Physella acuta TaxID=109671 RepID=UPI0027DE34C2|nr:uncharacterized protein LOC131944488 isoform X2 [Physella acuta]